MWLSTVLPPRTSKMVTTFSLSFPALFLTWVLLVSTHTTFSFTSALYTHTHTQTHSWQTSTTLMSLRRSWLTHCWMPRSASVVSRKGNSWCAGLGCTWTGSGTVMEMFRSSFTRMILLCGLEVGLSAPLLDSSKLASTSSDKFFVSSAASLTLWVSQKWTRCITSPFLLSDAKCLQQVLLQKLAELLSSQGWCITALMIMALWKVCVCV